MRNFIPYPFVVFAFLLVSSGSATPLGVSSSLSSGAEVAQSVQLPAELVGTYFYYDRRDHGYAFHLQLEADGTAYYMAQAEDGSNIRLGTWRNESGKVEVLLTDGERKVLEIDDYGQLIERREHGDRFFSDIRRPAQP